MLRPLLAVGHSKDYGIDLLIADKAVLVDFQANRFAGLMRKLKLSEKEWFVLRYLSGEFAVPLSVIALAADLSQSEAAVIVRKLIQHSLIVTIDDNYILSPPIKNAVERVKGGIDVSFYNSICDKLTKEFWMGENAAPTLEIVDATLNAAARTKRVDLGPYSDLIRVSTLHRLAKQCYYEMDWQQALGYVERARSMDPRSTGLCELHFKTLVRLERFSEAERLLPEFERSGLRNLHYLKGFLHLKKQEFMKAVESFKTAEIMGNKSQALFRDYAESLHRLGKNQEALAKIEAARKRDPTNIFLLDLYIRICLAINQVEPALSALEDLARYDIDEKFIHHRKSRLFASTERWAKALVEVEIAIGTGKGRSKLTA